MISLIIEFLILNKLNMMNGAILVLFIIQSIGWFINVVCKSIKLGEKWSKF